MISASLKLATWNVAQPVAERRRTAILSYIDIVKADVCVLTESFDGLSPGPAYFHSSASDCDEFDKKGLRWVTIWSRHRIEKLETRDLKRTAAVRIHPAGGEPFVVYGTVLPWLGSTWGGHPSAGGAAYKAALAVQKADWQELRTKFPNDELFILGDLNQDLVEPPRYYGSRENREALEAALGGVGMRALTSGAGDPVRRYSSAYASIDHICAREDSLWVADAAVHWPDEYKKLRGLSDHFGVSVQLRRR